MNSGSNGWGYVKLDCLFLRCRIPDVIKYLLYIPRMNCSINNTIINKSFIVLIDLQSPSLDTHISLPSSLIIIYTASIQQTTRSPPRSAQVTSYNPPPLPSLPSGAVILSAKSTLVEPQVVPTLHFRPEYSPQSLTFVSMARRKFLIPKLHLNIPQPSSSNRSQTARKISSRTPSKEAISSTGLSLPPVRRPS